MTLPPIAGIKALQEERERATVTTKVGRMLKAFCIKGGRLMVKAFEELHSLQSRIEDESWSLGDPGRDDEGSASQWHDYGPFRDALLLIKESLLYWEQSIGMKAFCKKHPEPRDVRYQYLHHALRLIYVISALIFPDDLIDWVEEFEDVLSRKELRMQFALDSDKTYRRAMIPPEKALFHQDRTPAHYIPYGLKVDTPYLIYNKSRYGPLIVVNERCKQKNAPPVYVNLRRFNPWRLYGFGDA